MAALPFLQQVPPKHVRAQATFDGHARRFEYVPVQVGEEQLTCFQLLAEIRSDPHAGNLFLSIHDLLWNTFSFSFS